MKNQVLHSPSTTHGDTGPSLMKKAKQYWHKCTSMKLSIKPATRGWRLRSFPRPIMPNHDPNIQSHGRQQLTEFNHEQRPSLYRPELIFDDLLERAIWQRSIASIWYLARKSHWGFCPLTTLPRWCLAQSLPMVGLISCALLKAKKRIRLFFFH